MCQIWHMFSTMLNLVSLCNICCFSPPCTRTIARRLLIRNSHLLPGILTSLLAWRLMELSQHRLFDHAVCDLPRHVSTFAGLIPDSLALITARVPYPRKIRISQSNDHLRMHQQNRYPLHRILARLTDYVETQSGQPSRYLEYVGGRQDALRGRAYLGRPCGAPH